MPAALIEHRVNHVVIVGDESMSMQAHAPAFIAAFGGLVSDLAATSQELGQETRISFYAFANHNDVRNLVWDIDVLRMPSIEGLYRPHGLTALIDASCLAIDDLSETPVKYGDHSFLVIVFTDGQENDSTRYPQDLADRIAARQDNWTFGIFVPDRMGMRYSRAAGFPEDNISLWDTSSAAGFARASQQIRDSAQVFMKARAAGERRVTSLFRVNVVSDDDLHRSALVPLTPGSYVIFSVPEDTRIDVFVAGKMGAYVPGSSFYRLTKTETVQEYKKIAIRSSGGNVYSGPDARRKLGLPQDGSARVRPAMDGCDVFVQSTSHNRKLIGGTEVLVLR